MQTPAEIPVMLQEMVTIGGTMTIAIVSIWALMVTIYNRKLLIQRNIKSKN
jgi:hypothetical protein